MARGTIWIVGKFFLVANSCKTPGDSPPHLRDSNHSGRASRHKNDMDGSRLPGACPVGGTAITLVLGPPRVSQTPSNFAREKRLRARPGRVRSFKSRRAGHVHGSGSVCESGAEWGRIGGCRCSPAAAAARRAVVRHRGQ
eukprot:gene16581-biopygen749